MRKILTFILTFALVLTATIPTFAAATSEGKENSKNPEILITYEEVDSGYEMTISGDKSGTLYINNVPYASNKTHIVDSPIVTFTKSNTKNKFVSGSKTYYLHSFMTFEPSPMKTDEGTVYIGDYESRCELIEANAMPKATVKAVSASASGFTVKWAKLSKDNQKKVSGVQVQYSTSSKFKNNVRSATCDKKSASKKISKLKKKTTYYVRVRTYKKSGTSKTYSPWSNVKKVKTK